jgi:hypothetical protein
MALILEFSELNTKIKAMTPACFYILFVHNESVEKVRFKIFYSL